MMMSSNTSLFRHAKIYIPGGVNSPVRSFQAVGGNPVFIKRAKGARLYSQDGSSYIDYCLSFGPLILGHAHPAITRTIMLAVKNGTTFSAPTVAETELAKLISEAFPSCQQVRLTNSGTEAVMSAIRLCRAYTGKHKLIKFSGAYHGHADLQETVFLPFNHPGEFKQAVEKHKKDLAAVIVEPAMVNCGLIPPAEGFLSTVREITAKQGIILIFDEVVTGFRLSYSGASGYFRIKPDLVCLGKIIGGGLPVGAFGGRKQIMQLLAPIGKVYQAGTFSGNPLTVNAGIATLKILKSRQPYGILTQKTRTLCKGIKSQAEKYGINLQVNHLGSMFSIFFTNTAVTDYASSRLQNQAKFNRFFHSLLRSGIYLSPSGFETNFLSTAHTEKDIEKTLEVAGKALRDIQGIRRQ